MTTNWRGYRIGAWVGLLVLLVAIGAAVLQGEWNNAIALAGFGVAAVLFILTDDRLPTLFDFLFVIAALLNAGGWVWRLFYQPGPYDEITHAFTTFAITLALGFLVYRSMFSVFRQHPWLYVLTVASFGIAIGAVWEIVEWTAGFIFNTEVIGDVNDTVTDLIMDSLGAGFAALLSLWALREQISRRQSNEQSREYHLR